MIRGVIFDIGGVLAHDVWEHLLCDPPGDPLSVSAKYDIPVDKIRDVGQKLWAKFDRRKGDPDALEKEYWAEFLQQFKGHQQLSHVKVSDLCAMTKDFVRPVNEKEMNDLLEWLTDRDIHLGICSNNNEFWFRRQAERLNLYRFFSPNKIALSCWEGINKGDLRMFHIAADKLGVHPSNCVFVDDRMSNVERAITCGMTGILFPTGDKRGAAYLSSLLRQLIK
jgi:HAD superfamily hydrolase (TIGR01509 family)